MVGFLLYALTAAVVSFGYMLFDMLAHPLAALVPSAIPGAIVLFAAGMVNFRKGRAAAGAALLGAIFLWRTVLLAVFAGLGLVLGFVFIVLPAALVISAPLALTTVYSLLVVTGTYKEMNWPRWLVPEDVKTAAAAATVTKPQLPRAVQQARILLYAWWAIVFTYVASKFRPAPLEFGLAIWIAQIVFLAAILWIVMQITKGKNWARITLLALFFFNLQSLVRVMLGSQQYGIDFAIVVTALAVQAGALTLVFSKASAAYFRQPQT
jgi:hypothetical protein